MGNTPTAPQGGRGRVRRHVLGKEKPKSKLFPQKRAKGHKKHRVICSRQQIKREFKTSRAISFDESLFFRLETIRPLFWDLSQEG
jgi:hypothetical protein